MCVSYICDEGRPFGICLQRPVSNHFKLLHLRGVVVSVEVKALMENIKQVGFRETSKTKPLLWRRNPGIDVKTKFPSITWDKLTGSLVIGSVASGV